MYTSKNIYLKYSRYALTLQEIMAFLIENFGKKNPPMVFCPHVQLDQSVILDLTILTRSFLLVFLLAFLDQVYFIEPL
jgi:hypothetical protein